MKRIIAILLVVLIAVFSLPLSAFAVTEQGYVGEGLNQFASKLVNVVRAYDKSNSSLSDESLGKTGDDYEYYDNNDIVQILNMENKKFNSGSIGPFVGGYSDDVGEIDNGFAQGFLPASTAIDTGDLTYEDFASKRLIVKSKNQIEDLSAVECVSGYKDLYIFQYETVTDAMLAYSSFSSNSKVEYVEPDYNCYSQGEIISGVADNIKDNIDDVKDDIGGIKDDVSGKIDDAKGTVYSFHENALSWVSDHIGFESIKEELSKKNLSPVKVAILDSGVDTDHELLAKRLTTTEYNLSSTGTVGSCEDDFGHGTHVAGIVADNTLSNVSLEPYKVLNNEGKGTLSLIAIAVDMAVENGANIINISIAGTGDSQTLKDSIDTASQKGIIVVAAAGNTGGDIDILKCAPACIASAITVVSVDKNNYLSSFSNFGSTVDIAAPGENVNSSYLNNTYSLMSGTSMAAPLVAAGVAIVKSVFADMTSANIEQRIKDYSIKNAPSDTKLGAGVLYLKYILHDKPTTPDPVFSVSEPNFSEPFELTLSCPDKDAKIVYLINSSVTNIDVGLVGGKEYTKPIQINADTKVSAIAVVKGKRPSSIVSINYKRTVIDENSKYDIDDNGIITAYYGTDVNVVVPDTVRGIAVLGIGNAVFKSNKKIETVTLPDTAVSIGNEAFYECTSLDKVTGKNIASVGKKAFQNSTLAEFSWENVETISASAFSGCNNLKNVTFPKVKEIYNSAFENADVLGDITAPNLTVVSRYAFRNSSISAANFPLVTSLGFGAFSGCRALTKVNMPLVTDVPGEAFSSCIKLADLNMPEVTQIGNQAFMDTALGSVYFKNAQKVGSEAFSGVDNATFVFLPKATSILNNAFQSCNALEYVYLPELISVKKEMFAQCPKLIYLSLPKVKNVENNAFDGSSVSLMCFDEVQTINSLPESLTAVMLPSTLKSVNNAETITAEIYGSDNTYAKTFAKTNDLTFHTLPEIIYDVPEKYSVEDKALVIWSVGYNCRYQWYISEDGTTNNGTLIDGADYFFYVPDLKDNAPYYYCEITGTDGEIVNTVCSPVIKNDLSLQKADYTEYNKAVVLAGNHKGELYQNFETLSALINEDVSNKTKAEQSVVDAQTAAILTAIGGLAYKPADYTDYNNAVKQANEIDGRLYSNYDLLTSALATGVSGKNITEQGVVNTQTEAILTAIEKLTYKPADYTAYNNAVQKANNIDETLYTNYGLVTDSLAVDISGKNITEQGAVNTQTEAILSAIGALTYKSADYTAYNNAVKQANEFDETLYSNFDLLTSALSVNVSGKNITEQGVVNTQTEAILSAIGTLTYKPANYTAYNNAVKTANELDETLYTNYGLVTDSLAVDVSGKNITEQGAVNTQTEAILSAIGALQYKEADYTQLDAALSSVPSDLSPYTNESVKNLNNLLSQVDRSGNISNQAQIDLLSQNITNAVASLTLKPIEQAENPNGNNNSNNGAVNLNSGVNEENPKTGNQNAELAVLLIMLSLSLVGAVTVYNAEDKKLVNN